jgi:hypothetical protein
VSDLTHPGAVPLRPLTTGELLDGAVALLRTRARWLVGMGVLLAVLEQAVLFPLRVGSGQDISMLPEGGRLSQYGLLLAVGFGTEAVVISTLAALAARRSAVALLGRFAPPAQPRRVGALVVVLAFVGIVGVLTGAPYVLLLDRLQVLGFVVAWLISTALWPLPYGLLGLAAPAVVIERRGPVSAVLRSVRLASRDVLRAALIRILGYVSWAVVRYGLLAAVLALVGLIWGNLPSAGIDRIALASASVLVNAIAYPVLGCLDVMLLLESRMRTEGLDIGLRWALRRGVAPSLEAPR